MSEEELTFSDTIQIVMTENDERLDEISKEQLQTPSITVIKDVVEQKQTKEVKPFKEVKKENIKPIVESKENQEEKDIEKIKNRIEKSRVENKETHISNTSKKTILELTLNMYNKKYNDYANIPDCIINRIFNLFYEKDELLIEETILLLANLLPEAKQDIDDANSLNEAIYVCKLNLGKLIFDECKANFKNIPSYSKTKLSNKIIEDYENKKFDNILYNYQLMRLSGYIK